MKRGFIYPLPLNDSISNKRHYHRVNKSGHIYASPQKANKNKTYEIEPSYSHDEERVQDFVYGKLFSPTGGEQQSGHICSQEEDLSEIEFVVGEIISEDFDESSYPNVVAAVSSVDICGPRGYTVPSTSSDAQSFDISSFSPGRFIDLQDSDIISRDRHNFADASSQKLIVQGDII